MLRSCLNSRLRNATGHRYEKWDLLKSPTFHIWKNFYSAVLVSRPRNSLIKSFDLFQD
jgi:hypothetical protein